MKLEVLAFSLLRPVVGGDSITAEIPEDSTVGELLELLCAHHPELREWVGKMRIAVDLEYAEHDQVLLEGQEIALIPPVQGG